MSYQEEFEEIKRRESDKEVYILFGDERETYTDVIGVFSSLKKALEKLEKWEAVKEKYHCWNCDYDLDDINTESEWYKEVELTEEYFKNKQCPNCKQHLSYSPDYNQFNITKHIIDGPKGRFVEDSDGFEFSSETVYEAIINDSVTNINDDTIKERFRDYKEYNLRKPNTKIKIINE